MSETLKLKDATQIQELEKVQKETGRFVAYNKTIINVGHNFILMHRDGYQDLDLESRHL